MGNAAKVGDLGLQHDGFHPTKIMTGAATVFVDGLPAARKDDPLFPHAKPDNPPHPRKIKEGSPLVLFEGKEAAHSTHSIDCGGIIVCSSTVTIG